MRCVHIVCIIHIKFILLLLPLLFAANLFEFGLMNRHHRKFIGSFSCVLTVTSERVRDRVHKRKRECQNEWMRECVNNNSLCGVTAPRRRCCFFFFRALEYIYHSLKFGYLFLFDKQKCENHCHLFPSKNIFDKQKKICVTNIKCECRITDIFVYKMFLLFFCPITVVVTQIVTSNTNSCNNSHFVHTNSTALLTYSRKTATAI